MAEGVDEGLVFFDGDVFEYVEKKVLGEVCFLIALEFFFVAVEVEGDLRGTAVLIVYHGVFLFV